MSDRRGSGDKGPRDSLRARWKLFVTGTVATTILLIAAIATISGFTLKDFARESRSQAQTTRAETPNPTPTISTPPTSSAAPGSTATPTPVLTSAVGGLSIQAFVGNWIYPGHEVLILNTGDILATGSLDYYYSTGPQTAVIRFTSRNGDTLTGMVTQVGPGTYLFHEGDSVAVTLINDGKGLKLTIGQNNAASAVLSRNS